MNGKTIRQTVGALALLVLALVLSGPAAAYDERKLLGPVEAVDLINKTVTVQGEVFQVSHKTLLYDVHGGRATLESLKPMERVGGFRAITGATPVEITTMQVGESNVMLELRVMSALPR